jgi:polysaccharide pyruvyl transferase WcaK-like protein
MNILLDITNDGISNHGDIAQHQVAVSRLTQLFPDSHLQIVTGSPERLPLFFPNLHPVPEKGHKMCFGAGRLFGRFGRLAPKLEERLRLRFPRQAIPLIAAKYRLRGVKTEDLHAYHEALRGADLVMIPGGGWITDVFGETAELVLETIALAQRLGKRTALMGHGFGPARKPALLTAATRVLPKVDLITVRESRASLPFLESLGVPLENVVTTGDDAIELAYTARGPQLGTGIGVNLRWVPYTGVNASHIEAIRTSLHEASRRWKAPLVPIPIEFVLRGHDESDFETIKRVLKGVDDDSDGGNGLRTPLDVIKQVGRCRLVVTSSYHGAVFALSQGIAAIALAKAAYFVDKFLGLRDQFGCGCELIRLDDGDLTGKLLTAAENMWHSADELRPKLLAAAQRQIELGREAYRRLGEIAAQHQPQSSCTPTAVARHRALYLRVPANESTSQL